MLNHWNAIWSFIGILGLILGYSVLSVRQHRINPNDTTIPSCHQIWQGFKSVITPRDNPLSKEKSTIRSAWLYQDGIATYGRLVKGLTWGCFLSVILGILMGCHPWVASLLVPPLAFLAKVPGTAMLAVFFVVVGTGEPMFATMIGFGVLPTLTQSIYLSARDDIHQEQINKAYTLGASKLELITHIVFPQILPRILDAVRLQIGPAMVYLIAAEMLVGQVGMGYQIRMQQRLLHMDVVYSYLILLGTTGLLMDRGMILLRKWLCPWFQVEK